MCSQAVNVVLGKGQSTLRSNIDIKKSMELCSRRISGDLMEVIVEEYISFDYEITLLTLTQKNGKTLFCPPIGHRQNRGDYQQSWQPMEMSKKCLHDAKLMAQKVTTALGGYGIWGGRVFYS